MDNTKNDPFQKLSDDLEDGIEFNVPAHAWVKVATEHQGTEEQKKTSMLEKLYSLVKSGASIENTPIVRALIKALKDYHHMSNGDIISAMEEKIQSDLVINEVLPQAA